jgi:PAS domain S-box-containing protein
MEELRLSSTPAEPSKENGSRRDGVAIAGPQAIPAAAASAGREALHAINQRIFETSLDLILVVERRGTIIRVSPSAMAILGYRPNEMVGRSAAEFLYHEDLDRTRDEMRAARRGRETRNFACRYVHKDGRAVTLEWTGVWSEPEQQHFFIGRDVTVLKATEQRLQERSDTLVTINRQLSAILKASPVAIFMIDPDGKVVLWNESAERIFGFTAEEALGRLPPYLDDDHMPEFWGFVAEAATDASATGFRETKRRRKDGALIDVSVRWARVNDEAGQMLGLMCAIADTTERRRLESHLRQAQKMEAVGNLTGGMAHDFNNLLGIIVGNLDLARTGALPDGMRELVEDGLRAALRGAELTRRLLAFARRQPLKPERVEINGLVKEILELLSRTLGEAVEIKANLSPEVWPVVIDPAQLEASLANLATNARDAMPTGGRLMIATENRHLDRDYTDQFPDVRPGDYVLIEVSDTGTGIAPDIIGRVFEPFFTTKPQGKGTGLGLSMVFGFVKQSGGHLNVYSELGAGTTFRLYLPRALAGATQEAAESRPDIAPSAGETILVVEDNPGMRRVVVRQLQGLGYRVRDVENGPAALEFLAKETADLLFSDVVMPGEMDGYELARRVTARWPRIKIVLTSGFPEAKLNGGFENSLHLRLLSKPYRRDDLARLLRDVLDQ